MVMRLEKVRAVAVIGDRRAEPEWYQDCENRGPKGDFQVVLDEACDMDEADTAFDTLSVPVLEDDSSAYMRWIQRLEKRRRGVR